MLNDRSESTFDLVNPCAANMIEALRDIGYSLESAVADIIDNSIAAGATQVDIAFGWQGESSPWIAISDDGCGMSESELVEAMRPGGRDPMQARNDDDLGRFGLGLKTASFSQCRKLTVVTRRNGEIASRQWDLDLVREANEWRLRRPRTEEISALPGLQLLGQRGTLVVWQALDRLDLGDDPSRFHQVMNERMAWIVEHVSLVFHRFIAGEPKHSKVKIQVNGRAIDAYDPFNARHAATMHLGEEVLEIEGKKVTFRPYILPHHSKVTVAEYERLGGREGYLRGQGFYIYRNRRLIIHGTWFRMARQDEITKLARVQVDIPNTLDHLWTIDVRKSRAHPPEAVKRRLRAILDRVRESARRPYAHRGTTSVASTGRPMWTRLHLNDRIRYLPNIEHPVLDEFRSDLPETMRSRFDGIVQVIGESLPYAQLFNDIAARPKETDVREGDTDSLRKLACLLFEEGLKVSPTEMEKVMLCTEPFASAPVFVSEFVKQYRIEGGED